MTFYLYLAEEFKLDTGEKEETTESDRDYSAGNCRGVEASQGLELQGIISFHAGSGGQAVQNPQI